MLYFFYVYVLMFARSLLLVLGIHNQLGLLSPILRRPAHLQDLGLVVLKIRPVTAIAAVVLPGIVHTQFATPVNLESFTSLHRAAFLLATFIVAAIVELV